MHAIDNPPNPWLSTAVEYLEEVPVEERAARLMVYEDATREILSRNDSPDLGFRWSVNPYRGCWHGCAYCYARPTHEYLSFGAGTDFERKIVVKRQAAALLRAAFDKPKWVGETIMFSGATDCYQPLEASYGLTRACLEVCAEYRNPVSIVTKAPLIERDVELLARLASLTRLSVIVSIPFRDEAVARALEPYVATPARRLKIIARLAAAGVPVGINVAPFVPGASDEGLSELLGEAAAAGARWAGFVFVRLPAAVATVFVERVRERLPGRAERILARVTEARGGKLYDARFGKRTTGEGVYADQARAAFEAAARRHGLHVIGDNDGLDPPTMTFQRPPTLTPQLSLF